MRSRSMKPWTAAVAAFGALGVVAPLNGGVMLPIAACLATVALVLGAGWARVLPWIVLVAIVLAALLAPVKMVDRVPNGPVTAPKAVMTIAELREPYEHGLDRVRVRPCLYLQLGLDGDEARYDDLAVRFPSTEMTVREFVRAIEQQTPLRHYVATCGTESSILLGSYPMGLVFQAPERGEPRRREGR